MIDATYVIEKDLDMRANMYGKDDANTEDCLKYYVNTCNDYAM
jgi:hypothetical protein